METEDYTHEEKDNAFIHIYWETVKMQTGNAVLPFFLFIIYALLRIIFRGNIEIFHLSYKQILYFSIASFLTILIHSLANINNLEKKFSLRTFYVAGLEGLSLAFSYMAWLFYIYCIVFIGLLSLLDFKYGFSIFPIIKLFLFGAGGIYGLIALSHLLKVGNMLSNKKEPNSIVNYIFKNKLYSKPK